MQNWCVVLRANEAFGKSTCGSQQQSKVCIKVKEFTDITRFIPAFASYVPLVLGLPVIGTWVCAIVFTQKRIVLSGAGAR